MTKKIIILIITCLTPWLSYGASITANILTSPKQIKVIRSLSDSANGALKTPLCSRCPDSILNITPKTILLVKGQKTAIEELLKISLEKRSERIQLQYYKNSRNINYIEWGESELDKRLLQ